MADRWTCGVPVGRGAAPAETQAGACHVLRTGEDTQASAERCDPEGLRSERGGTIAKSKPRVPEAASVSEGSACTFGSVL